MAFHFKEEEEEKEEEEKEKKKRMAGTSEQTLLWWVAGVFVLYTVAISMYQILQHLLHYTVPQHQKYIVRVLLMVPVYALDSWFALRFVGLSVVVALIRECYEAYVLYSFFLLLVNYLEGEEKIIEIFGLLFFFIKNDLFVCLIVSLRTKATCESSMAFRFLILST